MLRREKKLLITDIFLRNTVNTQGLENLTRQGKSE
jgi:hypothetical protein